MDYNMVLTLGCGQQMKLTTTQNKDKMLAILMAMQMQRYDVWHIAQ